MSRYKNIVFDVGFPKSGRNQISAWILLNRVYCKHSIYHKTPYNKSGGESKFPKEDEEILNFDTLKIQKEKAAASIFTNAYNCHLYNIY